MIDPRNKDAAGASLHIRDAKSLSPHEYGIEYGSPARGLWNIVHTGMLVPECHQIFVCAQGCLRGVVLTAAEMDAMDRFSTIAICENNTLDGDMESLIIDGVADILDKLQRKPRAVMVFTSCIHHFMGCDLDFVYAELRRKFPDIDFTDCYMNPIMRKTKTAPDPKMREQMYSLLKPVQKLAPGVVNIIGNNFPTDESSDLYSMLKSGGYDVRDVCRCKTYDEFQLMAESAANITYHPAAVIAADTLRKRLGQKHINIPLSYDYDEITNNLKKLSDSLMLAMPDVESMRADAEAELARTAKLVGDVPIAIDYTATPRPLGLAKLLLVHGMNVISVYADVFSQEESSAFDWLRENTGDLMLYATVHPKMGILPHTEAAEYGGELLAIGQKAAFFTGTRHFVNILECGGHYGFNGICRLMEDIRDAFNNEKDTEKIIQVKGWGCCC